MRAAHILLAGGLAWMATALYVMCGNIILRETPIEPLADAIDRLPGATRAVVFIVCWVALLLGWIVPLIFGVWAIFRPKHRRTSGNVGTRG
jgi:hypothetical protein